MEMVCFPDIFRNFSNVFQIIPHHSELSFVGIRDHHLSYAAALGSAYYPGVGPLVAHYHWQPRVPALASSGPG